jgi:hypothetical protein
MAQKLTVVNDGKQWGRICERKQIGFFNGHRSAGLSPPWQCLLQRNQRKTRGHPKVHVDSVGGRKI